MGCVCADGNNMPVITGLAVCVPGLLGLLVIKLS